MEVKKFIASTAREALHKIKEMLGPDAIILSNRAIPGGVEIMAVASSEMDMMIPTGPERALPEKQQEEFKVRLSDHNLWPGVSAKAVADELRTRLSESSDDYSETKNPKSEKEFFEKIYMDRKDNSIALAALSDTRTESIAEKDFLDRTALTKALTSIIIDRDDDHPFAIALFGHWGSGKSSQIQLLKNSLANYKNSPEVLVAEFNAWKNEKADNIAAVMAQIIVERLICDLCFFDRITLALRLASLRKEPLRQSLRLETERLSKFFYRWWCATFPIVTLFLAIGLAWLLAPKDFLGSTQNIILGSLATISTISIASYHYLRKNLTEWFKRLGINRPFSIFSIPDYSSHYGLIGEIHRTLHHLCRISLKGESSKTGRQLLLIVDDLDRCAAGTVKAVFDAVRLVADIPRVITLIAIDERAAFAAVEKHFDQFTSPERTPSQAARDYLAKVLQVSFTLPDAGNDGIDSYIKNVLFRSISTSQGPEMVSPNGSSDQGTSTTVEEQINSTNAKDLEGEELLFNSLSKTFGFFNPRLLWRLHVAWKVLKAVTFDTTYSMKEAEPLLRFLFWREWLFQQDPQKQRQYSDWLTLQKKMPATKDAKSIAAHMSEFQGKLALISEYERRVDLVLLPVGPNSTRS